MEGIRLAVASSKIDNVSSLGITEDNLKQALKDQFGNNTNLTVINNEDSSYTIKFNDTGRIYYVESTGNIIENNNILKISTEDELKAFRDDVNNGNTFEGKIVGLLNNIKLSEDWIPIGQIEEEVGANYEGLGTNYFKGTFLGNGYYIENVNITASNLQGGYNNVGFFSKNFENIMNLELKNVNINVSSNSGLSFVGGISGFSYGNIENCKVNGEIEIASDDNIRLGGVVGQLNEKTILNVSSDMQITVNKGNQVHVGGIIGYFDNNGKCQRSYNRGNINIENVTKISTGGIIGTIQKSTLKNCYNIGTITLETQVGLVGGISGSANTVKEYKNVYNLGNINVKMDNTSYSYTGGISGQTYMIEMENAYNSGEITVEVVTTNKSYCGGIVGYNISSKINNTYNVGNIIDSNVQYVGNIVGGNVNSNSEIRNSYYSNNTISAYGMNSGYIDDDTVNYTTQVPDVLEIINEENAFKQDANNINNGYPILTWQ